MAADFGVGGRFAPHHRADRWWFPLLLALLWFGLLRGFVPDMLRHAAEHTRSYLPIVHVHALLFVGWMLLLTTQMTLIRRHQVARHRQLGQLGVVWAPLMVLVGGITSFLVDRSLFGTKEYDPAFLSVQIADLLNFSVLVACALTLRADAATHKRLMMLGAVALANAGFARWMGGFMIKTFGSGFIGNYAAVFTVDALILAAFISYDTATRGRPHKALLWGGGLLIGVELLASWLYVLPGWVALSDHLVRP